MTARAAVILAAGQGTRMKSPTPKVLHKIGGRTLLDHAIDAAEALGCERIVVVVGTHSPQVGEPASARLGESAVVIQDPPLGTGHAVLAAKDALADFDGDVVVTFADCPLLTAPTIAPLFDLRAGDRPVAVLGFEAGRPGAYGRLIMGADNVLLRIVEAKDADDGASSGQALQLRGAGRRPRPAVRPAGQGRQRQRQGRVLPDRRGRPRPWREAWRRAPPSRRRRRCRASTRRPSWPPPRRSGSSAAAAPDARGRRHARARDGPPRLGHPDRRRRAPSSSSWSSGPASRRGRRGDPRLQPPGGRDVVRGGHRRPLRPPAARRRHRPGRPHRQLRRGQEGQGRQGRQGQPPELSGRRHGRGGANIGAGTIFCNYDGFDKFETHVGEGAFIGSNTALVAPVTHRRRGHDRLRLGDHQATWRPAPWPGRGRRRPTSPAGPPSSAPRRKRPRRTRRTNERRRSEAAVRRGRRRPGRGRHGRRPGHRLDRGLVRQGPGGAQARHPRRADLRRPRPWPASWASPWPTSTRSRRST
jgi:bifunctional UDP-N-acetylglucosamine pyrophosphorylase/glucosamine-1-phosphate N-acetyltransferase